MKKLYLIPRLFVLIVLVSACKSQNSIPYTTGDTSANSLDWEGQYQAILPCADCEGMAVTIFLNYDGKYLKSTRYIGKSGEELVEKGKFKWNDAGSSIFLKGIKSGPNQYLVGENQLFQLDMNGDRITGELADNYRFKKINFQEDIFLFGKKWLVSHIEMLPEASLLNPTLSLLLDPVSGRITGFSGCNNFNGIYEKGEENELLFSKIASTRKYCEGTQKEENAFFQALEKAKSYQVSENQLELFDENHLSLLVLKDDL